MSGLASPYLNDLLVAHTLARTSRSADQFILNVADSRLKQEVIEPLWSLQQQQQQHQKMLDPCLKPSFSPGFLTLQID